MIEVLGILLTLDHIRKVALHLVNIHCWWTSNAVHCSYRSILAVTCSARFSKSCAISMRISHWLSSSFPFDAKTHFLSQVNSKFLIYLACNVTCCLQLKKHAAAASAYQGENFGLLYEGKGIRETMGIRDYPSWS